MQPTPRHKNNLSPDYSNVTGRLKVSSLHQSECFVVVNRRWHVPVDCVHPWCVRFVSFSFPSCWGCCCCRCLLHPTDQLHLLLLLHRLFFSFSRTLPKRSALTSRRGTRKTKPKTIIGSGDGSDDVDGGGDEGWREESQVSSWFLHCSVCFLCPLCGVYVGGFASHTRSHTVAHGGLNRIRAPPSLFSIRRPLPPQRQSLALHRIKSKKFISFKRSQSLTNSNIF